MKTWWRMVWLGAAAVTAFAGALAGPVHAAVLVNMDLRGGSPALTREGGVIQEDRDGEGWRAERGGSSSAPTGRISIDLVKAGLNPRRGTLDFVIKRDEDEGKETLFTLYDKKGEAIWALVIDWEDAQGWNQAPPVLLAGTVFMTYSREDGKRWMQPWIPQVPFKAGRGRTFRITMTWDGVGNDKLYINGRKIRTKAARGDNLYSLLRQAVSMDLGVEVGGGQYSHSMRSVIKSFKLLDVATAREVEVPEIKSIAHNAARVAGFSGKLVAGNSLDVTLRGTRGMTGAFDIVHYPDVGAQLVVDWRGWGVYPGDRAYFEEGEAVLRNVRGYEVFISQSPFDPAAPGMEPVARLKVGEQQYTVEAPEPDKPYYVAVVALKKDGDRVPVITPIVNQPLVEAAPGVYTGSYTVEWRDRYPRAALIGRLTDGELSATLGSERMIATDPSLTIAVATEPKELKADEASESRIDVTVTDANGNPVPEHDVRFSLFTTSQYTGVVGGGAFAEQVGGTVRQTRFGKTDLFGRVSATYVAGFAAKTAIIVARDMLSNDVGSGWVKTYISATAQLQLESPLTAAAMEAGYEIKVTSSDEWLTADGKSTARITARVTQYGKPVEGHKVSFAVASGTGRIRVVKDVTGRDGEARAVYTAGTKIGLVLITATDTRAGIAGSVQIELRSDAPAKLAVKVDPETLPADGRSSADLEVVVTDINDNPNDGVEVEYAIVEGSGELRSEREVTDRSGRSATEYVAGRTPGRVSIEITVRSTEPTPEEIATVQEQALAVPDFRFF